MVFSNVDYVSHFDSLLLQSLLDNIGIIDNWITPKLILTAFTHFVKSLILSEIQQGVANNYGVQSNAHNISSNLQS